MRVVLAVADAERAEWLAGILSAAGFSVAVLPRPDPSSPELRGADLLIADGIGADALSGAGPARRMLVASRDGTVDMDRVTGGFADVLPVPSPSDEIVARVRHALEGT